MRRRALLAASLLLAAPLASCSGGGGDSDRYVLRLDGSAELDGGRTLDAGRHRLEVGDTVRITEGTATLGLPGDRQLELRAGVRGADDSVVEVDAEPGLLDGHALLVAGDDETASLRAGEVEVAVDSGAARVRRSTGVTVAVYEGRAEVAALGRTLAAGALRQVAVAGAGTMSRRPSPLVFDRDELDPWDRRYLGPAVDLGGQLERASVALSRRLDPPASDDAAYYRSVVPALRDEPAFGPALLQGRTSSPGETVVGASIVLGADGAFPERWEAAWRFRDDGADWGLVALDQDAARAEVIGVLGSILDAVAASIDLAGGPFGDDSPLVTAGGAGPSGGGTSGGGGGTGGGGEGGTPGSPTPTLPPIVPTLPPLLPGDDDDGEDVGVLPTVPEPELPEPVGGLLEPVTDPLVDTVNGVVDTVDGLLGPVLGPVLDPLTGPLLG